MKHDIEREYLIDDMLAKEAKWLEEERLYEEERNKSLPAIIKVIIPPWIKKKRKPLITSFGESMEKKNK